MRKRLSSSLTIMLTISIMMALILGLVLILVGIMSEPMVLIPAHVYSIITLAMLYIVRMRLKTIHIDDTHLYIGNHFSEVAVELEEIEEANDVRTTSPRLIIIQFYHEQPFGKWIVFFGTTELFLFFGSHPSAMQIRSRRESKINRQS